MSSDQPALLLRGGAVFDSDARTFCAGVDVLCAGGRISAVRAGTAIPNGADVLDCRGMWVLPGLIDCHVHITSAGEPNEMTNARGEPLAIRAWKAAGYARRTLNSGITTVRDLGAAEHLNIQLANGIESGLIQGPRVLAAGMGVTMTGGHGHGFIAREADGPDEVRKGVREQLRAGAKAVKLFASGGVMTPGVDPRSPSFTEDEMRAGVEEAHKAFRVVAAHAQATEGIKNAIRAGVDSIEHGVWLDDEALELMCERGTYLVPTLTAPHHIYHGGLAAGIPPYMVEKARQVLEDHIASYRAALKAGVRVAMGTDQGTPLNRPGDNAQEVVRMAEHGLAPAAAILAATAWAADLLRLQGECGRIKEGLAADLLVLRGDPIEGIGNLSKPEDFNAVVKAGRIVAGQAAERRTYEPA
ncbi:MAG: amidohydrolase family protein [Dehalococcoidia bacterium]|nr:amidohydrolase family protein [Dehalococcoidia bacterium]NUQ56151.1 amidohydrolase family protein [Dehalococcoidia bacterium]RIL04251.1 MAG: amidohydrolase family protein [bacterium]